MKKLKKKIKELINEINLFEIIVAIIEVLIGGYLLKISIGISTMLLMLGGFHMGKRII